MREIFNEESDMEISKLCDYIHKCLFGIIKQEKDEKAMIYTLLSSMIMSSLQEVNLKYIKNANKSFCTQHGISEKYLPNLINDITLYLEEVCKYSQKLEETLVAYIQGQKLIEVAYIQGQKLIEDITSAKNTENETIN